MIKIGTSGWSYQHWSGILYPPNSSSYSQLNYYLKKYDTVEINSSFYHWPRNKTFKSWYLRTTKNFILTIKAPRMLTHFKRLYAPEKWISRIAQDLHEINQPDSKMGPLLVQLSPYFSYDYARLQYFLEKMPQWIKVVMEFRHPSWHQDAVFQLLEKHNASYCVMSGYNLPCIIKATNKLVYLRLHGIHDGCYREEDLQYWAARVIEWAAQGRDVFVYFNNDGNGYAIYNSLRLKSILSV